MPSPQRFTPELLQPPAIGGIDMLTRLRHFALITYAVPPERVRPHVNPRFELDTYIGADGSPRVWISVVPFEDVDFHLARLPWPKFQLGQTNYRTYVIDRTTGDRGVWFFGTTLGGWPVAIPRTLWKMPWHYGRFHFDMLYDTTRRRYTRYKMTTASDWGAVDLDLEDSGDAVKSLAGFDDLEAGLVRLTHPLIGIYHRRDGRLGSYRVWHDRLNCTVGRVRRARFDLLDRLGLVPLAEQQSAYNVLIQPETAFIVKMPPTLL